MNRLFTSLAAGLASDMLSNVTAERMGKTMANTAAETMATLATSGAVSEMQFKNQNFAVDIDKLFLITHALWELLKTEHGYTDEMLAQKVLEMDLADGKLDGKIAKTERPNCSSCGKKLGRHPACMFCGTVNVRNPFER